MKTALYYIRTRCNYSQSMVARELNVSRQIYSAWESGAKALPALRRSELANLFGIPEEILLECEEATVERFCDQPIFSRVCQGKQVFSFQPDRELRVFLGAPDSQRPAEHCAELMNSKKALDDIEIPESVAEPILARAKFHGFLATDTEFDQIAEDPDYSSHADNAKRMLDALHADPQPDSKQP